MASHNLSSFAAEVEVLRRAALGVPVMSLAMKYLSAASRIVRPVRSRGMAYRYGLIVGLIVLTSTCLLRRALAPAAPAPAAPATASMARPQRASAAPAATAQPAGRNQSLRPPP